MDGPLFMTVLKSAARITRSYFKEQSGNTWNRNHTRVCKWVEVAALERLISSSLYIILTNRRVNWISHGKIGTHLSFVVVNQIRLQWRTRAFSFTNDRNVFCYVKQRLQPLCLTNSLQSDMFTITCKLVLNCWNVLTHLVTSNDTNK